MKHVIETEKFNVESDKLLRDYTISLLGDLHVRKNTSYEFLDSVLESVYDITPDITIIDGDLVYDISDFYDQNVNDRLQYILRSLSSNFPVFIVPGNHDIKENRKYKLPDSTSYLKSLESISNLKVLNNEIYNYDGINLMGFSPRYNSYMLDHQDEFIEMFVNDYYNSLSALDYGYNVLVTHSPLIITRDELISIMNEELSKIDLILCAHMHDGLTKKSKQIGSEGIYAAGFEKRIVNPLGKSNYCRGMHDINNSKLIITRGIRKWVMKSIIFDLVDRFKSHDVTTVELIKKQNN